MSELTRKTDTGAENELQDLISSIRPCVAALYNERIQVEDGRDEEAAYFPDAIIDDFLILEAAGKGSASAQNEKRDEALRRQGKRVVHLTNRILCDPDGNEAIFQFIVLIVELHAALKEKQTAGLMAK